MSGLSIFAVFSSQFGAGVSAANAATNPKDTTGTVIGIGQAAQAVASVATLSIETKAIAAVPIAGAMLSLFGINANLEALNKSYSATGKFDQADVASLVSNVAGLVGGGAGAVALILPAAAVGAAPIIVMATVVGIGAGAYQLVATNKGWTFDPNGGVQQTGLSANQIAQAQNYLQSVNTNQSLLNSSLGSMGVTSPGAGYFLVPQIDANGNIIGSSFQQPISTGQDIDNPWITTYGFSGGIMLSQDSSYPAGASLTPIVPSGSYDRTWTFTSSSGLSTLQLNSSNNDSLFTGSTGDSVKSQNLATDVGKATGEITTAKTAGQVAETITTNNANVNVDQNGNVDVSADGNDTKLASASSIEINGTNNAVSASNTKITLDPGTSATVSGSGDTITVDSCASLKISNPGLADALYVPDGATATFTGTGIKIALGANSSATITSDPNAPNVATYPAIQVAANDERWQSALLFRSVAGF